MPCAASPRMAGASGRRAGAPTSPATCNRWVGSARSTPSRPTCAIPNSIARAVAGATTVVNAVGIASRQGRQTFEAVHVAGARAIARAAREAGVKHFVHVSAIGADPKAASDYARTKGEGERAVLEEFPDAVILRPSIVFGPEDKFFNRFGAMAQISPFLPLIGGGRTKFQPVFVGDLADAIGEAAAGHAKAGTVYEIGGPEVMTFRQIMDKTKLWTGRDRMYFRMPFWLAKLGALLTWPLPNAVRPLTFDQVRLLQSDNIVSDAAQKEGRTIAAFGVTQPHSVGSLVPLQLERFRPKGQFSHYRG